MNAIWREPPSVQPQSQRPVATLALRQRGGDWLAVITTPTVPIEQGRLIGSVPLDSSNDHMLAFYRRMRRLALGSVEQVTGQRLMFLEPRRP